MIRSSLILAFTLLGPTALVDDDVLEPSIQNEVDHALNIVPTNVVEIAQYPEDFRVFCATNDFFGTNGLTRTQIAVKLISCQKAGGLWQYGTNDVTAVAVEILKGL